MKYKDLTIILKQIETLQKRNIETCLVEHPPIELINSMGFLIWFQAYFHRIKNCYEQVKDILERYYYQNEESEFDYKEEVLNLLGNQGDLPYSLPLTMPSPVYNYLKAFLEIQTNIEDSYVYPVITDPTDAILYKVKKEVKKDTLIKDYQRIVAYSSRWSNFQQTLLNLAKQEKYGILLDKIYK